MDFDNDRKAELQFLSRKFSKAAGLLKNHFTSYKLAMGFLKKELRISFYGPKFTAFKDAHLNDKYLKLVSEGIYKNFFDSVDPYIETTFNRRYDGNDYIVKTADPRLAALIGKYFCYTWDEDTTDVTKEEYIHFFKMEIITVTNIACWIKGADLKGVSELISDSRIGLEFRIKNRRLFFVFNIGNSLEQYLKKKTRFDVMYLDSGSRYIQSGLVIFERTDLDDEPFARIEARSTLAIDIAESKGLPFIERLKINQVIF